MPKPLKIIVIATIALNIELALLPGPLWPGNVGCAALLTFLYWRFK